MGFPRNSRQREVILEELRGVTSHPTASELHEMVRLRIPKISLGTVYRNLEKFKQEGLVLKLDGAGEQARFDGNPKQHPHVRCVRCGCVSDLHASPSGLQVPALSKSHGFEILGLHIEYVGVCPHCRHELPRDELARLRSLPR
ncbi:Fur family transcriptional regulator [Candidatus Eisenbacteria bacterium]|uniref:Fur family transcriptional regulator n=1 Tax=Eiseniibacteriota bacterium TaxID=2212470 RepID=A0ABV6YM36_UNCEI